MDAVLTFPENFTKALALKQNTTVTLQVEGTDQMKSATVNRAIINSTMEIAANNNQTIPMKITTENYYADGFDFKNLFIYRIMALVTLIFSGAVALISILGDKSSGIFNEISRSPVKAVISYIVGLSMIAFLVPIMVLFYVVYVMGMSIAGDITSAFALMLLIAVAGVSLGVLATSITRNEKQAFGIYGVLIILQVLFAGLFVPVARFDYIVQLISYSLPLSYGLDAMKGIVLRGFSLGDVGMDLLAITAIIVTFSIISMVGMKVRSRN